MTTVKYFNTRGTTRYMALVGVLLLLLTARDSNSFPRVIADRTVSRTAQLENSVYKLNTSGIQEIKQSDIAPTKSPVYEDRIDVSTAKIHLDTCKAFTYKIPNSHLRYLGTSTIELLDENGSMMSDSPIQFNYTSQELYGILTQKFHRNCVKLSHGFKLRGRNSSGVLNELKIELNLPVLPSRWNYKVYVKLEIMKDGELKKLDTVIKILRRISGYFKDEDISMIFPISYEFEKDIVIFEWSNHSLDYPGCSRAIVDRLSGKMFHKNGKIKKSFQTVFHPEFRLLEAYEQRSELCLSSVVINENNEEFRRIFRRSVNSVHKRAYRHKRSVVGNTPPVPKGEIGILNASYCALFLYQVPETLFSDKEDGYLRNLTLTLHDKNGTKVGQDSWIQIQTTLQTLYGYLKATDAMLADANGLLHYLLIATDSGGLQGNISFAIRIPVSPPQVFYKVELTVNSFENQSGPNVNEQIFLAIKIVTYFEDTFFFGVNILSFERNVSASRITFGWTNCTLTGEKCPEKTIETLIGKVIAQDGKPNSKFEKTLQPQYIIYSIKATRVGTCASNQSISLVSMSTITPNYSQSPQIRYVIPELTVTTTMYFTYQIPQLTFYDSFDGDTRSLALQLRTSSNIALSISSWIQFDTKTQTMYGILTSALFSSSAVQNFQYLLIATNSRGFSTQLSINIKGYRATVAFGAQFSISGRDNSDYTIYDVQVLTQTLFRLRAYLPQTRNNTIEVASFQRTLVGQQRLFTLVYYNTTITTSNCNALIQLLPMLESQGNLINPSLTVALTPDIVADRIDITRLGACAVISTSRIMPSPTTAIHYPQLVNRIPVLNILTGVYFYYQIPADTFYDAVDGNTRKLSLSLTNIDGRNLNQSSWLQFDTTNQHIYGLITAVQQTIRPYQDFIYTLTARNSLGYATSQSILIRSEYTSSIPGVSITLKGREYNTMQFNDVQLESHLITQLKQYLKITSNSTINLLSFVRQPSSVSLFSLTWSDSRLLSANCNLNLLRCLESMILSSAGVIHTNLIVAFTPSTILYEATINYYGTCLRSASSIIISPTPAINSPQYASIIPVINATYGMFFKYQIPRETFYDSIDGDTRNLRLSLVNVDGTSLSASASVYFNVTDQTLYGVIVSSLLNGAAARVFAYSLIVTNSRNYQTVVSITISVVRYQKSIGVSITTSTIVRYSTSTTDFRLMQYFINRISSYLQYTSTTYFVISSFTRKTIPRHEFIVKWTYSEIDGTSCNHTALTILTSMLKSEDGLPNAAFVAAMKPGFRVLSLVVQKLETCQGIKTETIPISTVIKPGLSTYRISTELPSKQTQLVSATASVPFDHPPKVTSRLLPLFAYFCIPFSYTIPADLFSDDEQGNTRNLKLRLETSDGSVVNESSWLQLSQPSQSLYGILKVEDFYKKPKGGYKYYLVAVDIKGQTARTDFTITIPTFPPKINHVVATNFNRFFDKTVPDVNEQLLIVTKILNYYNDENTNKINVISYETSTLSNTATIKWSNCSLEYTPCPHSQLDAIIDIMMTKSGVIKQSFRDAMTPYVINSISVEKLSPCNQSTLVESSYIQATITPSPSIGKPPYLVSLVPHINITWCSPFEFQIPTQTFHDVVDGSTRNLSLQLSQMNRTPIPENSWLKFDNRTQKISGYLKQDDLSSYEEVNYLLTATNKLGLSVNQIISFKITSSKPNPNHQLRVTTTAYLNVNMQDVDVRIFIWRRMKPYFQSSSNELISFSSFSRSLGFPSQLHFTYSNCSISEDSCDKNAFDSMLGKIFTSPGIINSNFIMAFTPEIVITEVKIEHLGLCTILSSSLYQASTTLYPTSSSIPSTQVTPAKNLPPLVLRAIATLIVDVCDVFTFNIPENTFYDVEDGLTRSLSLSLVNTDSTPLRSDSWVTFDASSQTLTAIVTGSKNRSADMEFLLIAADKGGLTASTKLSFKIQGENTPVNSIINMSATGYFQATTTNNEILKQFINKLSAYLSSTHKSLMRMVSFERAGSQLKFSWTPCRTIFDCNITAWDELERKLLVSPSVVNPDLVIALGPKIIVMKVTMTGFVSCPTAIKESTISSPKASKTHCTVVRDLASSSSVPRLNTPPRFMKTVPVISASLCSPFSLQLQPEICYDSEDGYSGTSITITYKNGTSLSRDSMAQYNQQNRTVYGVIKQSDLNAAKQIKEDYVIKCVDTNGLATYERLQINVTNTKINDTYTVTFHSYIYSISSQSDVDIQLLWMKKLQSYLQNPIANHMHFVYFTRLSNIQARFAAQLCNLDTCDLTAVTAIRDKTFSTIPFLNSEFVASMFPEFSLVSAEFAVPAISTRCPNISPTTVSSILHHTISPSLPTTTSKTGLSSSIIFDSPPTVRTVPIINITLCAEFRYIVPEDTFYDPEDGQTRNLNITLRDVNGATVNTRSWVQYDATTLTIYGYLNQDNIINSRVFKYQLVAVDRSGNEARLPITLRSLSEYKVPSHSFTTEANIYASYSNDVRMKAELSTKIKSYYGSLLSSGLMFLTFARFDSHTPRVVFTWSACSLVEKCDQQELKAISDKMLFHGTILNFEFIAALAPNFIVTKVRATEDAACNTIIFTTSSFELRSTNQQDYSSIYPTTSLVTMSASSSEKFATTPHFAIPTAMITTYTLPVSTIEFARSSDTPVLTTSTTSIPKVLQPLPTVTVGLCGLVNFTIPSDTFSDNNQAGSNSLKISARLNNNENIPQDSWIYYSEHSQTFLGQATMKEYRDQPQGGYKYIIRATNTQNYYTETPITFRILTEASQVNHNITMSIEEQGGTSMSNIDTISLLRKHIGSYFRDSTGYKIGVIEYARNMQVSRVFNITWFNCSLANQTCDRSEEYLEQIVSSSGVPNPNFVAAFGSYKVLRVQTAISDSCVLPTSSTGYSSGSNVYTNVLYSTTSLETAKRSLKLSAFTSYAISASLSTELVIRHLSSNIAPLQNTPPIARTALIVNLTYCSALRFKIPNDAFIDKENGDTSRLKLSLLDRYYNRPSCNLTIQLNDTSKEIHGIVLASEWKTTTRMLLEVTDSGGLSARTNITFIPAIQRNNWAFIITFRVRASSICFSEVLLYLNQKLSEYLPTENLTFISIIPNNTDKTMDILWTTCNSHIPPCNHTKTQDISTKVLTNTSPNVNLVKLLLPMLILLDASINTSVECQVNTTKVSFNITYCSSFNNSLQETILNSTIDQKGLVNNSSDVSYVLRGKDQQTVLPWIKFDEKTLSLLAYPVYSSLRSSDSNMMVLTVIYGQQTLKQVEIQLNPPVNRTVSLNFVIYLNLLSYMPSNTHDYDLLDLIMTKLSKYTAVAKHEFLIIDYNRTRVFPETVNIAISPCFSQRNCNATKAEVLAKSLIQHGSYPRYSFVQLMLPEFVVQSVQETRASSCINKPPIKNKELMNISVSLCTELYAPVENSTFFDQEDKTSIGLVYELLDKDGRNLGLDSWVQFNSNRRVIYGVPTRNDLISQPSGGYKYILRATDSGGLSSNITVIITITGDTAKSVYEVNLIFAAKSSNKIDMLLDLLAKIRRFFDDVEGRWIGFLSFSEAIDLNRMNNLIWTNCSLSNESCDINMIDTISQKLVTDNGMVSSGFVAALGSNYSLSRIVQEKSGVCRNETNTPPKVNASIPAIEISACNDLQYQIPKETFLDDQDGNTRSLLLYLKTNKGDFLETSSWIQLDTTDQTIYGIATYDVIRNQPVTGYSFVVHAQDSKGAVSTVPVMVKWKGNVTDRHLINMVIKTKDAGSSDLMDLKVFMQKSRACLNTTKDGLSIAYFNRIKGGQRYMNITVYSNCGNSSLGCNRSSINELYSKLTRNFTTERKSYIACMESEVTVVSITLLYEKKCSVLKRNTPPVVHKMIPLLNMSFCQALHYSIPNDTFIDADNDDLTITLLQQNGQPILDSDFIQLNKTNMVIYGFLTPSRIQYTKREYILQARDAYGATVNTTVKVKLHTNTSNTTYRICLCLTRYAQQTATEIEIIMNIMSIISYYLGDTSRDSLIANNYSITGVYPKSIEICFSNCSLQERCDKEVTDVMREKIFLRHNIVRPELTRALAPEFVISKASQKLSKLCYASSTTAAMTSSIHTSSVSPTLSYVTTAQSYVTATHSFVAATPSYVTTAPVPNCLNGRNTKPKIINSVRILTVNIGQPIVYYVAEDTAYDDEDGNLKMLRAELTDLQGRKVVDSWIYLDDKNKAIYISYLERDRKAGTQEYQFRLVVKDSCGASVYDIFKVRFFGAVSCCYYIEVAMNTSYIELSRNITLQYQIYKQIQYIYNDTQNGIQIMDIRNGTENNSSLLSFTNSSLTNTSCHEKDIGEFSDKALLRNGTAMSGFIFMLKRYEATGAMGRYNEHCNATGIIIPPIIPIAPVTAKIRSYEDWLWYILPFIILAFLIVLCCFLFYWCQSCCEACGGGKKAKKFDPFSSLAAKPLTDEAPLSKAEAAKAAEVAALEAAEAPVDEQALAAAAAMPLESEPSTDPPFEDMYAHIAPVAREQTVPSLHRDKKPKQKLPPWMLQAPKSSPEDGSDEPVMAGVAALPRTDDQPPLESGVAPQEGGVAPQEGGVAPQEGGVAPQEGGIAPQEGAVAPLPASEDPVTADVAPMFQRQPKYSTASTFSMFSSDASDPGNAAVSQQENPMTAATMPQANNMAQIPINEDEIIATQRPGTQAAPPPALLTRERSTVTETVTTITAENMHQALGALQLTDPESRQSASTLRLPSTPNVGPNEPPPPYSPPKQRQSLISRHESLNQRQFINQRDPSHQRAVFATMTPQTRSSTKILRPIRSLVPLQSSQADQVIVQRTIDPRQRTRQPRQTLVLLDDAVPNARPRPSTKEPLFKPKTPKMRDKRRTLVIRRPSASPRRTKRAAYVYEEPRMSPDVAQSYSSPRLIRRQRSPGRKSRKYKVYVSDSDSGVQRQGRAALDISDGQNNRDSGLEISDNAVDGKPVPIEVQGVFKAPENVLRRWFKESAFNSLANSLSPKTRQRESKSHKKSFRRNKTAGSEYLDLQDEAELRTRRSGRKKDVTRDDAYGLKRGSFSRKPKHNENEAYILYESDDATTRPRSPSRKLKRGYPYSKDPYEYVETALKTRPESASTQETTLERLSKGSVNDDYDDYPIVFRTSGRKPRKSTQEILARLSRRKQLKKKREAILDYSEA